MSKINFLKKVVTHLSWLVRNGFDYIKYRNKYVEYHMSDRITKPILITPPYIKMGENVHIRNNGRIEGVSKYNNKRFLPLIVLEDGVHIEQNCHITCAASIVIGKNTAIASNVTITDIHHPYDDVNIPIERQDIVIHEVSIGSDCKIYNNAVILPGVHIGKHVTVGANSVVTHDIPDFCVVAGAPAKILCKYNPSTRLWEKL